MDTLLARYFDGELDENEAREFMEAVQADPKLEEELRHYEQVLALGKKLPTPMAPEGFTRGVMAEVTAGEWSVTRVERGRPKRSFFTFRWAALAATFAVVVLAFAGGWWTAGDSGRTTVATGPAGSTSNAAMGEFVPVSAQQTSETGNGYRYVRLVYVPQDPSVEQVSVVGSFNNWDTGKTPMRRQGEAFSTILYLPPGSYEYMFVVDGREWVTDPAAAEKRDDGFGGANAVLDVYM